MTDTHSALNSPLKRRAKFIVSGLLLFHLTAVIAAPLAAPPSSQLEYALFSKLLWYIEPMFLNHGYRFFGPEPGPSYLVRYEIELADGGRIDGVLPDLQTQWPRVLYHRHFMLTSRLQNGPEDPLVKAYARSYAEHLQQRYQARRVRLFVQRHNLAEALAVRQGLKLSDRRLYEEFPLIDYPGGQP